ncbi:hypothetical protein ACHAXS_012418 [Conticribra weissflogii]
MSSSSPLDLDLLLDRLLSASTPSDCIDSLEQLQKRCRRLKPSNDENLDETTEEERQSAAIDAILGNLQVLHSLCSLIAQSVLPSQHQDGGDGSSATSSGIEVEGGDVAACELLLEMLPSSSGLQTGSSASTSNLSGATTAALQKQRQLKRRMEFISKTLLHFHENINAEKAESADVGPRSNQSSLSLIPSLLDCLCGASQTTTPSTYARVLSLQILQALLSASPGTLREQLMKAPDGINRLVDLLGHDASAATSSGSVLAESAVPEEVRNQAILFLTSLASSSSILARLITFSEGYDRALKIALESGSGLQTAGASSVTMDCLDLCLALAQADDVARELFLGGGDGVGNLNRLAQLMDLKGGERFRSEERNIWWDDEMGKRRKKRLDAKKDANDGGVGMKEKQKDDGKFGKSGKRGKNKKDDLDDILQGITTTPHSTASKSESTSGSKESSQAKGPLTPFLTPNETSIFTSVLNLLLVLLYDGDYNPSNPKQQNRSPTDSSRGKRRARSKSIVSHDFLCRSIVDCALYSPPPPGMAFVSAAPTPELQQKALVTMAVLGSMGDTMSCLGEENGESSKSKNDAFQKREEEEMIKVQTQLLYETMPLNLGPVAAIDRLLYLACTGAYRPEQHDIDMDCYDEESAEVTASLISTHAISTLRACLPSETASRMVLHALAPPPPEESDAMGVPLEEPHVSRMVSTLVNNLRFLQSQQKYFHDLKEDSKEWETVDTELMSVHQATIFAAGSAGTLGVFLTNGDGDAIREMLLRLIPPPSHTMASETNEIHDSSDNDSASNNLIDFILQHVATYDPHFGTASLSSPSAKFHASSSYVTVTLLRLLSEWVEGMPKAAAEVLSSPSSVCLGVLLRLTPKVNEGQVSQSSAAQAVPALSGLLLGLCLEYILNDTMDSNKSDSSAMESAAWTSETIMNMIQSMGVGKFLNLIDTWRKRPLPLPFCSGGTAPEMDQRVFATWYGKNVTLIRRRMVLALAATGEEDISDSDGDEQGDVVDNKSSRSLRKMLASQAKEIEELQAKLEEASRTISIQSIQMNQLQRVAELGTSAETNDMLSEYAEKVAELEQEKGYLMKEAKKQADSHKAVIAVKDVEILRIQEELFKSQRSVEQLEQEKETLCDEMSGLSAAYNSLEQEYHNKSSTNSNAHYTEMTAGGEAAVEGGSERSNSAPSHPGGEAAAEAPTRSENYSYQLQSLQDENARLREDVRAANEWMSMAVSRMEEMGTENQSLARALEEARTKASADSSASAEVVSLKSEIQRIQSDANASRISLENELKSKDDYISQQQVTMQNLETQIQEMSKSSNDVASTTAHTEELASLKKANKDAEEWIASAVKHVDALTNEIEELKAKNAEFESQYRESEAKVIELQNSLSNMSSEREVLQNNLSIQQDELASLREENQTKTTMIETLQSSLTEKASNESELSEIKAEIAALTSERDRLQANLAEFQSWSETAQSRMAEVETELLQVTLERDELKKELLQNSSSDKDQGSKIEIEALKSELFSKDEELVDLRDQLDRVQNQLIEDAEQNEAQLEELRKEVESEKKQNQELREKETGSAALLAKLSSDNDDLSKDLAKAQAELDSIRKREDNFNDRLELTNRRIAELEAAKNAAESQVEQLMKLDNGNLEDEIISITAECNEMKSKLQDIMEECEETRKELEKADMENGNLLARNRALEQDNKSLEYQYTEASAKCAKLTGIEHQLKEYERLLEASNEEKKNLQISVGELKTASEEAEQLWKEKAEMFESKISSLESQLEQQEKEATDAIEQLEAAYSALERSGEDAINQWQERSESLNAEIESLEKQLAQKDIENTDSSAKWESRCKELQNSLREMSIKTEEWTVLHETLRNDLVEKDAAIEEITKELVETRDQSEAVVKQWQERSDQLEASINELEEELSEQQLSANEAIAQWEARCTTLNEKIEVLEAQILTNDQPMINSLENSLELKVTKLAETEAALHRALSDLEALRGQKDGQILSLESNLESALSQLEDTRNKLDRSNAEHGLLQQTLSHKEHEFHDQKKELLKEKNDEIASLQGQLHDLMKSLRSIEEKNENYQKQLGESNALISSQSKEWEEKESSLNSKIQALESKCFDMQKQLDVSKMTSSDREVSLERKLFNLTEKYSDLESEMAELKLDKCRAVRESEDSKALVYQLQEELRNANEELQSFATDQFSAKATEMATNALRQQILELRSQYATEQHLSSSEREARLVAEEEVSKLKSDLALLAQATEYNEEVDLQVRKIAKKMAAENDRKERKEMEELRSTLQRLQEELGSCRWKEREAEEKAANANLHASILEQEVCAAKADLELMEQAMEELENSKIDLSVSMEYRIEMLENELEAATKRCEEEMSGIKSELAKVNLEKDRLAHKVDQSEKANAALVYSTSHGGQGGEGSESDITKLQLERAQLLAKMHDMGAEVERRVREAVAAHASLAEAELILEKETRRSIESTLSEKLSELEETKARLLELTSADENNNFVGEDFVEELRESLDELKLDYESLQDENKTLVGKIEESEKQHKAALRELQEKLKKAEERLRSEEKVIRFEKALSSEIANLRSGSTHARDAKQGHSQLFDGQDFDKKFDPKSLYSGEFKESVDSNSIYIIEMYDYITDLKHSIAEERQLYKDLLVEHENLLAILGQTAASG